MGGRREIEAFRAALLRIESGIWLRMKRFGAGFAGGGGWCSEMEVAMVAGGGGCDGGGLLGVCCALVV